MSFLAPLYVAGLAAISLPILLHLIRQMPRGRLPFSSLMFLTESPPRITRRSRIDNWLLLLLRAAAVALIALAFARPFLREALSLTMFTPPGRHVALLVDTSASMQRGDAWQQARRLAEETISELKPGDRLALFTFDRQLRALQDLENAFDISDTAMVDGVRSLLEQVTPTWHAADLGGALAAAAERLVELRDRDASVATLQVIVISDLPEGASLDALQTFQWPSDVRVQVRIVRPQPAGNAGLQRIVERVEDDASDELRVRVSNDLLGEKDRFTLQWFDPSGEPVGPATEAYVPIGQSRVFRVRRPIADVSEPGDSGDAESSPGTDTTDASDERRADTAGYQLRLLGDAHDYDNAVTFAPYFRRSARIGFVGEDGMDDPEGALFFLKHALGDTARHATQFNQLTAERSWPEQLASQHAVILCGPIEEEIVRPLRDYIEKGGIALWSLTRGQEGDSLRGLLEDESVQISENNVRNYLMLSDVNLRHPLFEPFRDPRFADFTTIRFWRSRTIRWDDDDPYTVIARFDDGSPALAEWKLGQGRCYLLASSWRPADSQLALSTKFVPLIGGLLREAGFRDESERRGVIGQPLEFPLVDSTEESEQSLPGDGGRADELSSEVGGADAEGGTASSATEPDDVVVSSETLAIESRIRLPSGEEGQLAAGVTTFHETELPGLYVWERGEQRRVFAVDVATSESRTSPRDPNTLEQYGVLLGRQVTAMEQVEKQRQMRDQELEGRQQVWRWMLASALVLLVAETWLAGRRTRGRHPSPPNE